MNKADVADRPVDEAKFKYGLSPPHSYTRFMECCCYIYVSYRRGFEKWTIEEEDDKITALAWKSVIQSEIKKRLGLDLDKPKQGSW